MSYIIVYTRLEVHQLEIEKHELRVRELYAQQKKEAYSKDRYDYARRYDEMMAHRALQEDFHAKKALMGSPQVCIL